MTDQERIEDLQKLLRLSDARNRDVEHALSRFVNDLDKSEVGGLIANKLRDALPDGVRLLSERQLDNWGR